MSGKKVSFTGHLSSKSVIPFAQTEAGVLLLLKNFIIILLYYLICPLLQIQIEVHIGLNHPFIVGYGANILCCRVNINR